jgi:hypothetical protein
VGTAAGSGTAVDDGAVVAEGTAVVEVDTSALSESSVGEIAHAEARRANAATVVARPSQFTLAPLVVGMCNASTGICVPLDRTLDRFGS